MAADFEKRLALLERRSRILVAVQFALALSFVTPLFTGWPVAGLSAQDQRVLTLSELAIVDDKGTVRVRISGQVPDAIIDGRPVPRGARAAGVVLYDDTGTERSGYVTFASPNRNVVLTLDNDRKQTALFAAGPEGGSALRLWYNDNAVELNVGSDGPNIHATQDKRPVFHEPPVPNPEKTVMCQEIREARTRFSEAELLQICINRSSEAACRACLDVK
jgi:hypothetical protein